MTNKKELNINELGKVNGGNENTIKYGFKFELEQAVKKKMTGYTIPCKVMARGYLDTPDKLRYYLVPDKPSDFELHRGWYSENVVKKAALGPRHSGVTKVDGNL